MKARFWFRVGPDTVDVAVTVLRSDTPEMVARVALFVLWRSFTVQPSNVRLITGSYLPEAA